MSPHPSAFARVAILLSLALSTRAASADEQAPKAVAPPAFEVVESMGSFPSQGKTIAVEKFEPKTEGKHPAVVVVHGAGGLTIGGRWFRESARDLARHGYVAYVVHYFDLTGTKVADPATMRANFAAWMKVVAEGITYAAKQPNVDPARIGLMGFSLGSYLSLSVSLFDPRVQAVVEHFGGIPEPLLKEVKTLPPTLILHGDADLVVPVTEAKALETLYKERNFVHEVCIYKGQGHGFTGEPGVDANRRAVEFLDKHVKAADPSRKRVAAPVPNLDALAVKARQGDGK